MYQVHDREASRSSHEACSLLESHVGSNTSQCCDNHGHNKSSAVESFAFEPNVLELPYCPDLQACHNGSCSHD